MPKPAQQLADELPVKPHAPARLRMCTSLSQVGRRDMTTYRNAKAAPKQSSALGACFVIVVASCGGGELTLTEYAEEVEGAVTTHPGRDQR
jgi:hypothetical protein